MTDRAPSIFWSLRGVIFSMLLGFHHALEQDEADLQTMSGAFRLVQTDPGLSGHSDLARSFLWGDSSMAN